MLVARVSWTRSPWWVGFFVDVDRIAVLVQHAVALHVLVPSVGPAGDREWEETNETYDHKCYPNVGDTEERNKDDAYVGNEVG